MNAPLSENANRLNHASSAPVEFIPETPQKPLTGTRLYQSPQRTAAPRRAHNSLMETVEQQRYAAKYEAPGAVLPQSVQLKDVPNPVDALKRALQSVWHSPETQHQALDVLLDQPGLRSMLSKELAAEGNDLTLAAMQSQLQEMEAERLMTLMQLDDAKKNLAAIREESLENLSKAEQKKLDELRDQQKKIQDALAASKELLDPLQEKCQEAAEKLSQMQKPLEGHAHFICPPAGEYAAKAQLVSRVEKSMQAAGFEMHPGDALALLASFALSENAWAFYAETEADALHGFRAFASALGTTITDCCGREPIEILPTGNAPVFLRGNAHPLATAIHTASSLHCGEKENADYRKSPYACLSLTPALDTIPQALPAYPAVSKECILKEMLVESPLGAETLSQIRALRQKLAEAGRPLALTAVQALCRFIAATQNDLPGGIAEAMDRAVCAYLVPHMRAYQLDAKEILPLLSAMPRALKALKNA